ncbi:MAG: hypothetical protein U9R52_02860, partial [Candidatus Omnitrophota bacterium]|nr:hypothetical protein [Candidatus Omnitrophota bacterium]
MRLKNIKAAKELQGEINIMPRGFVFTLLISVSIALTMNAPAQGGVEAGIAGMTIKDYLENALPLQDGRTINYNELTGILTVTDTPSNHRLIRELVKQFDIGPKQVLIEAKFVEISFTDLNEFGIEWYWYRQSGDMGAGFSTPASTSYGIHWDTADNSFPLTGFGGDFFLSYTAVSGNFVRAYLHALESEGKANLLASPRVTTLAGQMANIQITRTIPYVSDIDLENEGTAEHPLWVLLYTYDEKMTGITLEVTPYVSEATNVITLELHPEISTLFAQYPIGTWSTVDGTNLCLAPADWGYPSIYIRTTQATVKVKSGGTVIMGGFVKDDDTVYDKKIP